YHLLSHLFVFGVPGEVVELGAHSGHSAVLFQKVIDDYDPSRRLHVYDAFVNPPAEELLKNFAALGLRPPQVHAGWFDQTIPRELPEAICFAHLDCGPGPSTEDHERAIGLQLE